MTKKKQQEEEERIAHQQKKNAAARAYKPSLKPVEWETILSDYERLFKRKPEPDGTVIFDTQEEATTFFSQQASKSREFLVTCLSPEKQELNAHYFSCGNGKLYKGSFEEIKQQLEIALANNESTPVRNGLKTIENQIYRKKMSDFRKAQHPPEVDHAAKPTRR